ncbi:unnamed protein product [Periconia digitata]|uniref:Uncharacterized protein n=1 Tax=Periconia digitata TaxID=1303443 RepID=A0A9W4U1H4_9PLEO|nr:unnamed protein product [Periconia digitata]
MERISPFSLYYSIAHMHRRPHPGRTGGGRLDRRSEITTTKSQANHLPVREGQQRACPVYAVPVYISGPRQRTHCITNQLAKACGREQKQQPPCASLNSMAPTLALPRWMDAINTNVADLCLCSTGAPPPPPPQPPQPFSLPSSRGHAALVGSRGRNMAPPAPTGDPLLCFTCCTLAPGRPQSTRDSPYPHQQTIAILKQQANKEQKTHPNLPK